MTKDLLNNWPGIPRKFNIAEAGLTIVIRCDGKVHFLEGGAHISTRASPAPANDGGRVPREGVGGALREADGGHGLGEGKGGAQGQYGDVIYGIKRAVTRMSGDL